MNPSEPIGLVGVGVHGGLDLREGDVVHHRVLSSARTLRHHHLKDCGSIFVFQQNVLHVYFYECSCVCETYLHEEDVFVAIVS